MLTSHSHSTHKKIGVHRVKLIFAYLCSMKVESARSLKWSEATCIYLGVAVFLMVILICAVSFGIYRRTGVQVCPNYSLLNSENVRRGFVLSLDYSDQLTGGAMNLLGLQCLASRVDPRISVVEPFLVNSTFGIPLLRDPVSFRDAVRLTDVYDRRSYSKYYEHVCYSPLASWEVFSQVAPRNVILVQIARETCSLAALKAKYLHFFELHGYVLIREVCFNFVRSGPLTVHAFKEKLYGSFLPNNVTVVFDRWLGITNDVASKYAVSFYDAPCTKEFHTSIPFHDVIIRPNSVLLTKSQAYVDKYLGGSTQYIAVMLRLEKVILARGKLSAERSVTDCLHRVLGGLAQLKKLSGLNRTFLAVDVGRYGSKGFSVHNLIDRAFLQEKYEGLIGSLYGNSVSVHEWEDGFVRVSGTSNPGYIAALQRTVASEASCILLAGRGSFQLNTYRAYLARHKGQACFAVLNSKCEAQEASFAQHF